jgi:hypothetical protein
MSFAREVIPPAIVSALVATAVSMYTYFQFKNSSMLAIDTAIMYSLFLYTTWYAVYELWRAGYLRSGMGHTFSSYYQSYRYWGYMVRILQGLL